MEMLPCQKGLSLSFSEEPQTIPHPSLQLFLPFSCLLYLLVHLRDVL